MSLKDNVQVRRRFQRSIRLDMDLDDPLALQGFVCPPTFAHTLVVLSQQVKDTGHGAFTWTGPFGGGKSSLAVALSDLLTAHKTKRSYAMTVVGDSAKDIVKALNPTGRLGFLSLAIVGRKQDCAELVAEALKRDNLIRKIIDTKSDGGERLLETLIRIANRPKHAGLIIFIDEMGKILEETGQGNGDLHFLQELAEIASRSDRRLIVVGILHQAFAEYTNRMARQTQDKWMKVQGRFIDMPLASTANEQLALLARSIETQKPPKTAPAAACALANLINNNKGTTDKNLSVYLAGCWPLNPVTACLLGPCFRRRFGQNQRSIFSFLNSSEPHAFQHFLRQATKENTYLPAMLWDYLHDNFEPSILASPDCHRWSTALEAFERCESRGGRTDHLVIAKTIALIDLFRERTGFYASREVLDIATPTIARTTRNKVLKDLMRWSIVVYRRHLSAFAIHAGSDFEIDAAIDRERNQTIALDSATIQKLAALRPIMAKRHYHKTGAMRWVDVDVLTIDKVDTRAKTFQPNTGSFGIFVVALPSKDVSEREAIALLCKVSKYKNKNMTAGLAPNGNMLLDLMQELAVLEQIRSKRPELSGDAIARLEVETRLDATRHKLEFALNDAFLSVSSWYSEGHKIKLNGLAAIHRYVSDLAEKTYPYAPRICNELLNRAKPSSTAVAARRLLMRAMVKEHGRERLGFTGFPAEAGLFTSVLEATNLYRTTDKERNRFAFQEPADKDPCNLKNLWLAADRLLKDAKIEPISLANIFDVWSDAPYGVRAGLLPVLALAYLLSRTERLALYLDGTFRPYLDEWFVDRMHQEPEAVQIRRMNLDRVRSLVLAGIQDFMAEYYGAEANEKGTPLEVARILVSVVTSLPVWTQRTTTISRDAQKLRGIVSSASDPYRFLFDDLPKFALGNTEEFSEHNIEGTVQSTRACLQELVNAYPAMLKGTDVDKPRNLAKSVTVE